MPVPTSSFEVLMLSRIAGLGALIFALMIALAWLVPQPASAQATAGTILGTVTDTTGATIAGTNVTVLNVGTGVGRSVLTDAAGNYQFPLLLPGRYNIPGKGPDSGRRRLRRGTPGKPGGALRYPVGTRRNNSGCER